MPIDSRDKRFSLIGLRGRLRRVLPNPDGAFDTQADRQQITWLYIGILAVEPPATSTTLAVSRSYQRLYTVEFWPPLGVFPRYMLDYIGIDAQRTALHWRTGPGGWTDLAVGLEHPLSDGRYGQPLARPNLKRSMFERPFGHVVVRRGPDAVFEGRVATVTRERGHITGFVVSGYGLAATRDNPYSSSDTDLTTSGTVLQSMIANTAPHLRAATGSDWTDPAVSHAPSEFSEMMLADALDQVATEGDAAGNQVDWWVYEDQRVSLRPRIEPVTPDYTLPHDHRVATWNEDPTLLVGAVSHVRINPSDGTTIVSTTWDIDPTFVSRHGFSRSIRLQLGEMTSTAALALRKTYLRRHQRPVVSAALEFGPDDRLEGPYGRVRPKDGARFGQWVQVGQYDPERNPPQMVMTTDYDATADVLRMEVGEFVPGLETEIAANQKDRLRRQRGLSAIAGRVR